MDQATQQNAALVEEASAAAQSLQEQAGSLSEVVSIFKLDGASGAVFKPLTPVAAAKVAAPKAGVKAAAVLPRGKKHAEPAPKLAMAGGSAGAGDWTEF
jgi:hypothetical protein